MKHTVLRQYNHYIWHHTLHVCVCVITPTVSMIKYTLYLWHHIDCIYGTICTIYDISPTIYDITTLYSWNQSYYISPHTNYIWEHIHCISLCTQIIDRKTPIVCMITQPQYVWHHVNYIWHHIHSLWYYTTLWHHTHCIHVITPRTPDIASAVAGPILIVYWLYHTYYM